MRATVHAHRERRSALPFESALHFDIRSFQPWRLRFGYHAAQLVVIVLLSASRLSSAFANYAREKKKSRSRLRPSPCHIFVDLGLDALRIIRTKSAVEFTDDSRGHLRRHCSLPYFSAPSISQRHLSFHQQAFDSCSVEAPMLGPG